jgi:hypothetical protein
MFPQNLKSDLFDLRSKKVNIVITATGGVSKE